MVVVVSGVIVVGPSVDVVVVVGFSRWDVMGLPDGLKGSGSGMVAISPYWDFKG